MTRQSEANTLFTFAPARLDWVHAVQATVGFLAFMLVSVPLDEIGLGLQAAFVVWLGGIFVDDAIGLGRRIGGAAFMAVVIAVTNGVASFAGTNKTSAIVVGTLLAFLISQLNVLGPVWIKKATVLNFLVAFSIGLSGPLAASIDIAVASLVGGAGAIALILASWPFDKERRVVNVAARIHDVAAELAAAYATGDMGEEIPERRARAESVLQDAHADIRYQPAGALPTAVQDATRLMRAFSAYGDVRALEDELDSVATRELFGDIGDFCRRADDRLRSTSAPDLGGGALIDEIDDRTGGAAGAGSGIGALSDLRTAVADVERNLRDGSSDATTVPDRVRFQESFRQLLVANWSNDTLIRRHILRYSLLILITTALYQLLEIPDGFFIPIGVTVMGHVDLSTAYMRTQIFSIGVVIGASLGAVVGVELGGMPVATILVSAIVLFFVQAFVVKTFWIFALGLNFLIVALVGLIIRGGWYLGTWRIIDTLIGAAFVTVGLLVLWPSRGRALIPPQIARVVRMIADYGDAIGGEAQIQELERMRRSILARESSLALRIAQHKTEPFTSYDASATYRQVLAELQVIRGGLTDLSLSDDRSELQTDSQAREQLSRVAASLRAIADAFEENVAVPGSTSAAGEPTGAGRLSSVRLELQAIANYLHSLGRLLPMP